MSVQSTLPRRIAFHPLSCAEFAVVRDVLGQDDHFRLSHLGPLVAALATNIQRRPYIEKTQAAIAAVPDDWHLAAPPVFVLGFWRSGTTLLHEMLAADPGFASPRLMDILFPSDAPYLLGHKRKAMGAIARLKTDEKGAPIYPTRMVDLVEVALHRPQEEELAMCHLGAPSFFRVSFFPRQRAAHIDDALFPAPGSEAREAWRDAYRRFLKTLVAKYPGQRLLLKNPANSARLDDLREMYPEARFVRIDREREAVLRSFQRMMDMSMRQFSLQGSPKPFLREQAEDLHRRVLAKLDADWATLPAERRTEVAYADLAANPVKVVRRVYRTLGITLSEAAAARHKKRWENRVRHWSPKPESGAEPLTP
ncbi:sulfotransferase [Chelatococcus sambhunathii]|uniref:Sulfotransferase n=1 Tax=Chelatococcus sambhunathii TaxID=363953 RepID=A0ABU1DK73_9HYPH|nr:sulfotransferase [Chelatococcus sambhunathii]MDR4308527.1 sulfotransferase [Chelatococcus sambhunathii]